MCVDEIFERGRVNDNKNPRHRLHAHVDCSQICVATYMFIDFMYNVIYSIFILSTTMSLLYDEIHSTIVLYYITAEQLFCLFF